MQNQGSLTYERVSRQKELTLVVEGKDYCTAHNLFYLF